MLKKAGAALLLLAAVLMAFCGCSSVQPPTAGEVAAALSKPFTARVELGYGGESVTGTLDFSPAGAKFEVAAPEGLSGLTLALSAEGETLSFAGMEKALPTGALPDKAPVKLLNSALAAVAAGAVEITASGGEVIVSGRTEGGAFTLALEPVTLAPKALEMASADIKAVFC